MMTLSIVSHRQGALVTALLRDVARLDSRQVTAILVTRNVPDDPIDVPVALAPITTMIDNAAPRGFGANHNAAFARCGTALFAVLNPDIRLDADPFDPLAMRFGDGATAHAATESMTDAAAVAAAHAAARIAVVAPRIVATDGRDEDAARELMTPLRLLARRLAKHRRGPADRFDWLAGMFLVVRSAAFRSVGGFDPRYFMYCEDFDLCARLRLDGWTLVRAPEVCVIHAARRASHRSLRHLLWHLTSLSRMWTSSAFWRYRATLGTPAR